MDAAAAISRLPVEPGRDDGALVLPPSLPTDVPTVSTMLLPP